MLKPGGRVHIADLARPPLTWQWPLNFWYYRLIYGVFGKVFWQEKFPDLMREAGFVNLAQTAAVNAGAGIHRMWMSNYTGNKA